MDPYAKAKHLLEAQGSARARDLRAAGLEGAQIARLVKRGELVRLARGVYSLPGRAPSADEGLQIVARRVPDGFFCLLTALRFHRLTTQAPHSVWLGIPAGRHAPKLDWPSLRIVRYSGAGLSAGIETHVRDGVPLRVTGVARTVVDCFKFRNKIGLDVALEALAEVRRERRTSNDEIWRLASQFRMANVMRPYLESVA
ncbi:type IV toxin-antitoxin system AbiEi family antitoxin domain-containing protein [Arenimonas caeni]|uniref:Transcriptional regulator n=1 Tax=Arenimonas caeni TaxID=2058085 RepID=A0A2P6M5F7_9GAMM|nr:type IV toxin-antitoxin system AbiEi family antitoxin domain-containing protein [Arenimonas caeni]PRH81238.1 transcriptional regulator [Arenimonas caeni]